MHCITIKIHFVYARAMVHALMKQERRSGSPTDDVVDGQIVVIGNDAFRQSHFRMMASGKHDHVAHVGLGLVGEVITNAQLHEWGWSCKTTELVNTRAVLVITTGARVCRLKRAPGTLNDEIVTHQSAHFGKHRGM